MAEIPALAMLQVRSGDLERRARHLAAALERTIPGLEARVEAGDGEVGGGSLPMQRLPGFIVLVTRKEWSARELESRARAADPPVIGYLRGGRFVLDVRTLTDDDMTELPLALSGAWSGPRHEERE
jgi:L-seryl-tRNA(Ser) seleniumtransferase